MNSERSEIVLDSSAILAVLRSERGHERIASLIARSLVSVVNEAEVITVLIRKGDSVTKAIEAVHALPYTAVDLDRQLARRAGTFWCEVKSRGLSLGDRCCIALAERENLPVMTSDRRWAELSLGVDVRLFR